MAKNSFIPVMLGLLMVLSTMSGCLGDDIFESADKKGIPGGLTLVAFEFCKIYFDGC